MAKRAGLWSMMLWMWLPAIARAEACVLPEAPLPQVEHALGMLAHAPPPRVYMPPSRWRGLLPTRMVAGMRNGAFDEVAWYMANTPTEKLSNGTNIAWTLRFDWDLRPLWERQLPPIAVPDQHLARAERVEHLAERIALQLNQLRKAQALALQVSAGDLLCREAQSDAEAALLVIASVLNAARP
jgi:hypothetical protein